MKKNMVLFVITVIVLLAAPSFVYACGQGCGCGGNKTEDAKAQTYSGAIEMKNKVCPVMGGAIVEERAVKVEHDGKIYNLCCAGCVSEFKNDPKKYIEKIHMQGQKEAPADSCNAVQSCQG